MVSVPTPLGPFSAELSALGVCRSWFGQSAKRKFGPHNQLEKLFIAEVKAYFAGKLKTFSVPLDQTGFSKFQMDAYALCQQIPYAETRAYGDIAEALGSGARAVGRVMGALPTELIVPAHRVIRMDGSLGGYQGRESIKAWLIDFEMKHV